MEMQAIVRFIPGGIRVSDEPMVHVVVHICEGSGQAIYTRGETANFAIGIRAFER